MTSGLTEAAIRTVDEILAAVATCDGARLTALAGPAFRSSLGGDPGDPVVYWRQTQFPLVWIDQLFSTQPALQTFRDGPGNTGPVIEEYYIWPAAASPTATDADWKAAEALYSAAELATWRSRGGYAGFRLMVRPDGQWWGLLAGD